MPTPSLPSFLSQKVRWPGLLPRTFCPLDELRSNLGAALVLIVLIIISQVWRNIHYFTLKFKNSGGRTVVEMVKM